MEHFKYERDKVARLFAASVGSRTPNSLTALEKSSLSAAGGKILLMPFEFEFFLLEPRSRNRQRCLS